MTSILDDLRYVALGRGRPEPQTVADLKADGDYYAQAFRNVEAFFESGASLLILPPWSSTPPTAPGVYRFRGAPGGAIIWQLVVSSFDGNLYAYRFGTTYRIHVAAVRGEWCGPVRVEDAPTLPNVVELGHREE